MDTETEIINNVVYNWVWGAGINLANCSYTNDYPTMANIIGNYCKYGPSTQSTMYKGVKVDSCWHAAKVYVKGNVGPGRPTDDGDEWAIVQNHAGSSAKSATAALQASGIAVHPAVEAYDLVLDHAGATAPKRDTIDKRIVQSVRDSTGKIIASQDEVGDWPDYNVGTPPLDTDYNGMPDYWETARGLNPNDDSDAHGMDLSSEGYTNIEVYINSFFDSNGNTTEVTRQEPEKYQEVNFFSNYPNPFYPSLSIAFDLDRSAYVSLIVYNMQGKLVKTLIKGYHHSGVHRTCWDVGAKVPNGIYLLKLKIGDYEQTKQSILVR